MRLAGRDMQAMFAKGILRCVNMARLTAENATGGYLVAFLTNYLNSTEYAAACPVLWSGFLIICATEDTHAWQGSEAEGDIRQR
jgi:hypothetical protein